MNPQAVTHPPTGTQARTPKPSFFTTGNSLCVMLTAWTPCRLCRRSALRTFGTRITSCPVKTTGAKRRKSLFQSSLIQKVKIEIEVEQERQAEAYGQALNTPKQMRTIDERKNCPMSELNNNSCGPPCRSNISVLCHLERRGRVCSRSSAAGIRAMSNAHQECSQVLGSGSQFKS